jgi:hypothetical protein
MLQSADIFLGVELGTFETYLPSDDELAAVATRVQLLVSEHGRAPQQGACRRLAERFEIQVLQTPGTHLAHVDHPLELAQTMRPFLRQVTELSAE